MLHLLNEEQVYRKDTALSNIIYFTKFPPQFQVKLLVQLRQTETLLFLTPTVINVLVSLLAQ